MQLIVLILILPALRSPEGREGTRGRGTVEPFDEDRGERLLSQYLGSDKSDWDEQFRGLGDVAEKYAFIRFVPETVVERDQSYAGSLMLE